jgi:predicted unusual protein kinase regulating ubiquinone biosynthesis (AarF/ABC1/UbiB family)
VLLAARSVAGFVGIPIKNCFFFLFGDEQKLEHVFVDGLFHGDPHPGNLLVDDKDRIAFIDFGLVGQVTRELQDRMIMLLLALSVRDVDTTARVRVRVKTVLRGRKRATAAAARSSSVARESWPMSR